MIQERDASQDVIMQMKSELQSARAAAEEAIAAAEEGGDHNHLADSEFSVSLIELPLPVESRRIVASAETNCLPFKDPT